MIEQPTLGSRLLALRTEKGMTQYELREICHVSVRTIQRIESGAVTPRASTVKILLRALGENPDSWFESSHVIVENQFSIQSFKKMLLINATEQAQKNALAPAWIAGIIYLLLGIMEITLELYIEDTGSADSMVFTLIIIKVLTLISFFLFIRGFLSLSILFENQLLKTASYLSVAIISMISISEILFSLFAPEQMDLMDAFSAFAVVPIGAISTIFGLGILRLQDGMGRIAKVAGQLEIAFGIACMTLVLSFIGVVLLPAVLIVEIVLLSKADQLAKSELL